MLYQKPYMELIVLCSEDIVRTSGDKIYDPNNPTDGNVEDMENEIW